MDIETVFYTLEDRCLVDVVVASVDYAYTFGPALLSGSNGSPKDTLATTPGITIVARSALPGVQRAMLNAYQNGWKKPTMPFQSLSAFPPFTALPTVDASISSQSSSSFFLSFFLSAS